MKIIQEFKEFALRGNVIDLALGVVIGSAFGKVVDSLVKDIIMPPIGKLLGGIDFSQLYFNLSGGSYESLAQARDAGAVTINYGLFVNTIISFLIVAWAMFMVIKVVNRLHRLTGQEKPESGTTKTCQFCYNTIDLRATRCPACTSLL